MVALMRTTCSSQHGQTLVPLTHLYPLVAFKKLAKLQEQKVRVDGPLVHLVHHDMRDPVEIGVSAGRQSTQNHTGRDKRNLRVGPGFRFPSNCIALDWSDGSETSAKYLPRSARPGPGPPSVRQRLGLPNRVQIHVEVG